MVEDVPYTIITPIEQTTAEPLNFVGDAYYYDLTKKEVLVR